MATVRFYIRSEVNDRLAPIWIRFTDGRNLNIRIKTPFRMIPDYWNESKQALKQRIIYNKGEEIDGRIKIFTEEQATEIQKKLTELTNLIRAERSTLTNPATKEWLRSLIDKFCNIEAPNNDNLNDYIQRFITEATSGKRLATAGNTKKRYSAGSLRILRDFQRSFDHYQGIYKDRFYSEAERLHGKRKIRDEKTQPYKPLNFNDITIDFYNDFIHYFYDRKCSDNYIGKHIKSFKTIMRQAREEGLHNNMEVDRKAFKTISSEVDNIYLTEAELKKLFGLDLSKNRVYQTVRDVFLCGCYTAQRYSDYKRINKSMIKTISGVKHIELIQEKTGEKCLIPIRPELDAILKRYDYTLPKTFEQKVNENIKKIGDKAGITDQIHTETMRGGMKVKRDVKKCELIKTHTARRTGCSLMYLAGIPIIEIMKISGHKTPKEFMKYIRISKEETVVKLSSHPYFMGNLLKIAK
jgi:hypothetical protein